MQMLNLEKEERGGRGKRREEGDSCHIITIFQQLYTIVSSLIFLLSSYCGLKFGGKTPKLYGDFFPSVQVRESLGMTEQQAAVWLDKCS